MNEEIFGNNILNVCSILVLFLSDVRKSIEKQWMYFEWFTPLYILYSLK